MTRFWAFKHPLINNVILYDVCNVKLQLYAKGLAWSMRKEAKNIFYFLYKPIFYLVLSNVKGLFADNLRAVPTTFSSEKYHFLKNFYLAILWVILYYDCLRSL